MEYQQQIHEYIHQRREEILDTLKELVRIPSVRAEAREKAPFGTPCAEVLKYTKELYAQNGLKTELDEDGGYLLSYYGDGKKDLGLFAHGDVVPVNKDWIFSNPFDPIEKNGYLIGRGVKDDKSAIVISLYCAKMLKELVLPFSSRLVCFTGANEETGMQDMKNYLKKHTAPDFSLVCDTAFPLFRGNKGSLQFFATQKVPMDSVRGFSGGTAFNIILGEATAEIGNRTYTEKGISRHGALPEGSLNAAHVLAKTLLQSDLLSEHDRGQMQFISTVLEKYYGEIYGITHTDPDFGKLTVTNGIVKMNDGRISLSFDMRYGASVDIEDAKRRIVEFFNANGGVVDFVSEASPFIVPEDDPYIVACMETYKSFTNQQAAKPYVNAGGTYARYLPRAAEIGTWMGGESNALNLPQGHGHVHQPDECISIEGLLNAIEITMLMLLECDKV